MGAARTVQHDEHLLPLGVAHFGSLAEENPVLVTDEYSVEDKLGDGSVGETPKSFLPADISDELQALHVDQGLNQLVAQRHLPGRLQGTEAGWALGLCQQKKDGPLCPPLPGWALTWGGGSLGATPTETAGLRARVTAGAWVQAGPWCTRDG